MGRTSATNPAVVGEVSLRALALLIAGQDPGKIIEVKPHLITRDELDKSDIKTVQDLDKKTARLRPERSGDRSVARGAHTDAVTG